MAVDSKFQKELNEQVARQPKLSALDWCIWLSGAALSWTASVGLWFFAAEQIHRVRAAETEAVAVELTMSLLLALPATLLLFCIGGTCLIYPFQRFALFGKKGAVYEGSTHRDVPGYPVFMDLTDAPEPVRRRVWKARRVGINVAVALVVCLYMYTWSWNGRQVMMPDGAVVVYSGRGTVKAEHTADQVERFALRISEPHSGRHGSQEFHELDLMIRFRNGQYFTFQMKNAVSDDDGYLRQLLQLKEQFGPEIVRVEDAALLEDLIRDQGWTGETERLARSLFAVDEK